MLYNGADPYPDEETLKLSDMFSSIEDLGLDKTGPALELQVRVLNINEGKNEAIAKKCTVLAQYSAFVGKVREFEKNGYNRQESVKKAVVFCRNNDILKELLEEHASEVLNMLTTEWNWDDAKQVWFEDGFEEGIEKGIEIGEEKGTEKGMLKAIELFEQGLSVDEIKQRFKQMNNVQ